MVTYTVRDFGAWPAALTFQTRDKGLTSESPSAKISAKVRNALPPQVALVTSFQSRLVFGHGVLGRCRWCRVQMTGNSRKGKQAQDPYRACLT